MDCWVVYKLINENMNIISWSDWLKAMLSFVILIGSILIFEYFGLDTNFLITFILAIISITISVSFFVSSSRLSHEMKELINEINLRIKGLERKFEGQSSTPKFYTSSIVPGDEILK